MHVNAAAGDIGHVIQLAVAPVFLLTAVATLINVLSGRLARAVDRRRSLAVALPQLEGAIAELARQEFDLELRRSHVIYRAVSLAVTSALLIAALMCLAFIDAFVTLGLGKAIALLFVLSLISLMASLVTCLYEIFLAVHSPRAPVR